MEKEKKQLLILSAHADDHIACAGTIMKLKEANYLVYEIVLTRSNEGRDFRKPEEGNVEVLRENELSKASEFLGIERTYLMNQEDLNLIYSKELMLKVAGIIRTVKPTIGIIMNDFDWHIDHRATFQLGSEAFKWAGSGVRPDLGDAWRTPMVLCSEGMLTIKPNVLVDISKYALRKKELWKIYESQARPQAVVFDESIANIRGYQLRRKNSFAAEAFTTDPTAPLILFDEI